MTDSKLMEMAKKKIIIEAKPKKYNSKLTLVRPLINEDLKNILYLINEVYSNEDITFIYDNIEYSPENLLDLSGKKGKLELMVGALRARNKGEDLCNTLQDQFNLDAEDCAEGLKEYIEVGLGYNS